MLSFLSPCVLPLVPAYVSMVSGLSAAEIEAGERRQPRAACCAASSASSPASPWSSPPWGRRRRVSGTCSRPTSGLRHRRRAGHRRPRGLLVAGLRHACPCSDGRAPLPPPALAPRRVGPAGHGHGLRLRLDAVHRAGPRRRARPGGRTRAPSRSGLVLLVAYSLGLGVPFLSPVWPSAA